MWNENYCMAATEVLDILNHVEESDVKKIPIKFLNFLKEHSKSNYSFYYDYSKPIYELDLKQETRDILGLIYRKWWATKEEKEEIYKEIRVIDQIKQKQLAEKYSYDSLFKKHNITKEVKGKISENKIENVNNVALVKYNDSFFVRIINKLKNFFKIRS